MPEGFGGGGEEKCEGTREREFNRRVKKVLKKGRGQGRRRDVNGMR